MLILKGLIKLTKDVIKPLEIVLLTILFFITVIFIKYKPVYTVTISGKTLGYVTEKSDLENRINEYINYREGTIALIDIQQMPEYHFELIPRNVNTTENEIFERITDSAVITYRTYAVTLNGESKVEVDTEIEAQNVIQQLQSDLQAGVEFELGIVEVFKTEQTSVDENTAFNELNSIKVAKTEEYQAEQARIEAERLAAEQAAREEAERQEAARKAAQAKQSAIAGSIGSGNVNGLALTNPLRTSPLITSRFGESSSRRYSSHTGLDLATSLGTPVYPIANGVVTFAGWQGSYGNLVIVDHGDGIQSWYAHCSEIYVGVGTEVTTETNISAVGSTGNSTGPHLHLEIRINGTAVNPQNYLY